MTYDEALAFWHGRINYEVRAAKPGDLKLERMRALPYPPQVAMLTTFDVDEYVGQALRLGASGFLLKDTEPNQLVRAVREIAAGGAVLDPGVASRLREPVGRWVLQ